MVILILKVVGIINQNDSYVEIAEITQSIPYIPSMPYIHNINRSYNKTFSFD